MRRTLLIAAAAIVVAASNASAREHHARAWHATYGCPSIQPLVQMEVASANGYSDEGIAALNGCQPIYQDQIGTLLRASGAFAEVDFGSGAVWVIGSSLAPVPDALFEKPKNAQPCCPPGVHERVVGRTEDGNDIVEDCDQESC